MAAGDTIDQIIAFDEKIASLRETFEALPVGDQEEALISRFTELLAASGEGDLIAVGMVRLSEMLLTLGSEPAVKTLGQGMNHANPDIRLLCADALLHLATEDLDTIRPAIEDALASSGPGSEEMPFLLMELDHPDVPMFLERFLGHKEAMVVAAAVEAFGVIGNDAALPLLNTLQDDERVITVQEEGGKQAEWTIGRLAKETIELLS
ncbi:MAG: hypothetical protein QNJ97_15315 [Myxococcota bacterium]|nr:hypothetical protein [Myxococcota bacterium]